MWEKLLISIARTLFRKVLLPRLKIEADKAVKSLKKRVVSSTSNPVDSRTIDDIEYYARDAIDDIFAEFE